MKKLETLGRREREVVEERRRTGYRVAELVRFGGELEPHLRALLERLLPGVSETIDLVGFVDANAEHSLGRGDRSPGLPPVAELYRQGLEALARVRFASLPEAEQDALVGRLRRGEADDELGIQGAEFAGRLLVLALAGYLAHPDTWERIGFNGPAFPEGYAWLAPGATVRRHEGFPGAGRL